MKKIMILFFIVFSFILFAEESDDLEYLIKDNFGLEIKVGLSKMQRTSLYFKSFNGDSKIIFDGKEEKLLMNDLLKLTYKNGNVYYKSKPYKKIELKKDDVVSLLGISKDNETYKKYRGNLEIIPYGRHMIPVNVILAEEYLYSVVPSEIGLKFPDEAIKTQAVAARTYLYYSLVKETKYKYFNMMDDTSSQVYKGFDNEDKRINRLVNATVNEVASYSGEAINALYHSDSGGMTANNEDVWKGNIVPYLRSVDDKDNGNDSPRLNWSYKVSKKRLSKIFGYTVKTVKVGTVKNKRVKTVVFYGNKKRYITGNNLRKLLGYTNIFNTVFRIVDKGNYIYFYGNGSGHGVGMSQWGAYGLAEKGYNYKEILKYYYTGIEIKNVEKLENYAIIKKCSNLNKNIK